MFNRFVGKIKPEKFRGWWIQAWSVFKRPTPTLAQKKQITNDKFSTWAPLPTLKFYFVLHQEVQLFLHLLYQSSNSIFDFNLQILSSTSIFKFYLRLQSSNSIFDFNLRASFARLSFQVHETCWKSPKLNRRILAHFEKMSLARWFWAFFEKIVFDV